MRIDIATLFPEMCDFVLSESIVGRARKAGLVEICCTNIRDFADNKHNRVDDKPYGGGTGMVMQAEPIFSCVQSLLESHKTKPRIIYMSPQGKTLTQEKVKELSRESGLILICGHYEGVDQRVLDELEVEEISIGDYVLTGGEIPAMALADAVVRLLPDVLPNEEAYSLESHYDGILEQPQYTRPEVWRGREVPKPLLNGAHIEIEKWRKEAAIAATKAKRPELFAEYERKMMKKVGIIGAMPSELEVFRSKLSSDKTERIAGYEFHISEACGVYVYHVCCGIGKVNAAVCTQLLIDKFNVDYIINTGIAGGIAAETRVLDIVISKDVMHHDLLARFLDNYPPFYSSFKADKRLVTAAVNVCKELGERFFVERIVSGEVFVSDNAVRDKIIEEFNPYAVDMETAAIAHAASRNEVPFVSVRCISDKADDEGEMTYDEFSAVAARKVAEIVIKILEQIA